MNAHKNYILCVKILAVGIVIGERLYLGNFGPGTGVLDGILVYAILFLGNLK